MLGLLRKAINYFTWKEDEPVTIITAVYPCTVVSELPVPVNVSPDKLINPFEEEENIMPLVKGKKASSKKGFSENVKREMKEGKPQKQAVAIAYSEARHGKKGKKK